MVILFFLVIYVFIKHCHVSVSGYIKRKENHKKPCVNQEVIAKVGTVLRTQTAGLANKQVGDKPHRELAHSTVDPITKQIDSLNS